MANLRQVIYETMHPMGLCHPVAARDVADWIEFAFYRIFCIFHKKIPTLLISVRDLLICIGPSRRLSAPLFVSTVTPHKQVMGWLQVVGSLTL